MCKLPTPCALVPRAITDAVLEADLFISQQTKLFWDFQKKKEIPTEQFFSSPQPILTELEPKEDNSMTRGLPWITRVFRITDQLQGFLSQDHACF